MQYITLWDWPFVLSKIPWRLWFANILPQPIASVFTLLHGFSQGKVLNFNEVQLINFSFFNYLFLERGEGREKEWERNINVWLPPMCPPTGDPAHNTGMCPDWESNQQPFGWRSVH